MKSTPSRPCAAPDIGCLRPIRIFKAESFRFAALFALVFLTLTGVLIGTVLWIVAGTERNTLIAANEADISTVTNGLRAEGLDEAIEVVQQRLGTPAGTADLRHRFAPETYMVIEDANGQGAGGQPAVRAVRRGHLHASPYRPAMAITTRAACSAAAADSPLTAILSSAGIPLAMYATRERILHAFAWVALGTCAFAILGGLFLGRRFMARVDAITQTCERVIAGRLNERIPIRGRADEWDRLARAINEMLDRISTLLENLQQVSSDIAHDLRTPLTRLRNRLEAARETIARASRTTRPSIAPCDRGHRPAAVDVFRVAADFADRSRDPRADVRLGRTSPMLLEQSLPVLSAGGRRLRPSAVARLRARTHRSRGRGTADPAVQQSDRECDSSHAAGHDQIRIALEAGRRRARRVGHRQWPGRVARKIVTR